MSHPIECEFVDVSARSSSTQSTPAPSDIFDANEEPVEEPFEVPAVEEPIDTASQKMVALHDDESLRDLICTEHIGATTGPEPFCGFPNLFENPRFADVHILVGPEKAVITAHRAILSEESEYFKALFSETESPGSIHFVELKDCHIGSMQHIIRYLYTGEIRHSRHPGYVSRLYKEAAVLGIKNLERHAISYFRDVMRNEIGYQPPVSASYVTSMIRGLEQQIKDVEKWEKLGFLFESIVERVEYDDWMDNKDFIRMLDDNPIPSRMLFQIYKKRCPFKRVQAEERKQKQEEEAAIRATEREMEISKRQQRTEKIRIERMLLAESRRREELKLNFERRKELQQRLIEQEAEEAKLLMEIEEEEERKKKEAGETLKRAIEINKGGAEDIVAHVPPTRVKKKKKGGVAPDWGRFNWAGNLSAQNILEAPGPLAPKIPGPELEPEQVLVPVEDEPIVELEPERVC